MINSLDPDHWLGFPGANGSPGIISRPLPKRPLIPSLLLRWRDLSLYGNLCMGSYGSPVMGPFITSSGLPLSPPIWSSSV